MSEKKKTLSSRTTTSSRCSSASNSVASSTSSGPAISVDGLRAADIETTTEWAMTETILMRRINDIIFKPGSARSKDLLLLKIEGYNQPKKHTEFRLSKDRLEFARLLNIMRVQSTDFGIEDLQNKAKRDFLANFPTYYSNAWGCQLVTPYVRGKGQMSRRTSQTSISSVPGTAEWYGKQETKTAHIKDVLNDENGRYLLVRTSDGDFHSTSFLSTEDTKVLANLKNLQDYLPDHRETVKAKFLRKYSAVAYNEGQRMLIVSPDYQKKERKTPKKTLNQYRFSGW